MPAANAIPTPTHAVPPRVLSDPARPRLSVVIPMYQEQARIAATLADLVPWLESQPWTSEVLLVNDGSKDQTEAVASPWVRDQPTGGLQRVRLLRHVRNQGKGAAVRTGLLHARGLWTLMMDADNAATIREVQRLFDRADQTHAALITGSRVSQDSQVQTSASRGLVRWGYRTILRALGLAPVSDTQCGFKLYRADAAASIAARARENGFVFDIEHFLLARQARLPIAEVGITWVHQEGGTVHPIRDGLKMLARALALRWRALTQRHAHNPLPAATVEVKPMPGQPPAITDLIAPMEPVAEALRSR